MPDQWSAAFGQSFSAGCGIGRAVAELYIEEAIMKSKMIGKLVTDIILTVALLLLMTYELIGQAVHEWIGVAMFVLVILHHVLNGRWSRGLLKGK